MKKYLFYIKQWLPLKYLHGNSAAVKYAAMFLLAACFTSSLTAQPNITKVEYYIDADPGYGKGIALPIVPGKDLSNLSFNIDVTPLYEGVHIVGVRSKDANGAWSLDNHWIFLKPYTTTGATAQPNINYAEYYFDGDPGYGNGIPITLAPGKDLNNLSFNIDIVPLYEGVHVVGVRSRDANGAWSLDNHWIFLKPYKTTGVKPQPKIDLVEYYIDNDPGYGNATALKIAPGQDLNNLSFNIDYTLLTEGVHVVGVRSRDANGAWSHDNHWLFLKPYSKAGTGTQPNITRVEYFVDKDPGYGKGTPVTITPGKDLKGLSFLIDMTQIGGGLHKVGVRSLDANGGWSLDNEYDFTGGTLPVELINFAVLPVKNDAKIMWSTVTESNSKQFIIQRSTDGTNFETIGTVAAAGFSNSLINYSYIDPNVTRFTNDIVYYRLMQVDNDNRFYYSEVRKIRINGMPNALALQQNPVHGQATLLYTAGENDKVLIQVINNLGQVILTKQITVTAGLNNIGLSTEVLAAGIYTIHATGSKDSQTVRMMKE